MPVNQGLADYHARQRARRHEHAAKAAARGTPDEYIRSQDTVREEDIEAATGGRSVADITEHPGARGGGHMCHSLTGDFTSYVDWSGYTQDGVYAGDE